MIQVKEEKGRPLESAIKNIISGLRGAGKHTEEEVDRAWKAAVGKKASSHSRVVSFKKSGLVVNVDGSGWLYELTLKKRGILKKLEEKLKGKGLKEIRFRIGEVK